MAGNVIVDVLYCYFFFMYTIIVPLRISRLLSLYSEPQ